MKKLYPLLVFLIGSCSSLFAQQTTFQSGYNFGTLSIPILTNICQSPSGKYLVTGTDGVLPIRGVITEIDSAANWVFTKEYVSTIQTEIVDVKNVPTGGFIVAGESNPGLVLMRLDNNANVVWANTYHVGGPTEENASRVLPTSDHGFVVAGYVYEATPPGYARQDSANCFIMKTDSNGTLLWAKVVFCSVAYINDHLLNDVAEDQNGYVFVGSMSAAHSDASGTYDLVIKTDYNGNVMYAKHYGGGPNDGEATSITKLNATTQLIAGDDNSESFWINFNSITGTGSGHSYAGVLAGFPPYLNFSATPTFDGNYAMIGMAPLSFSSYLLKVNSGTGNVMFGYQYKGPFASILPEGTQTKDSGFAMVTTALGTGGYMEYVVKTDALGTTSAAGCAPTTFNPTKGTYSPTYTAFAPDSLVGATTTAFTPTIFNVTPTDTIYCADVVCTPPPNPTTSSASPATICSGSSSTITGSGSGSATYEVFTTPTGGSSIGNTPLSVSPTSTTTYYVEAHYGAGCFSAGRTPVTVTVTPVPSAVGAITGSLTPCIGAQAYSIGAVTNASTYSWSVSGGGSVTAGSGTTNVTVTWTTAGGPYTVLVTASNSCGSASNSINVTVGGSPAVATASASPNPACAGQNVTLSFPSSGATTYAWAGPGGYASASSSPLLTGILSTAGGNYTVTASNACGSVTGSVNLVVNATPTAASATANPNPACQGQTVNLTGSATGAASYGWTGPNAYTSAQPSPSLTNVQANEAGVYTLIASNTCGNDTTTLNLVVNTTPTAVIPTATPNPVCVGATVNFSASATGAASYAWSGPNGFTSASATPSVTNFQNANAGVYTLTATNTCGNSTASVTVNIATAPTGVSASANNPTTCYATNVQLTGTATGATSYGWTGPEGFVSSQQDTGLTNTIVAESGTYIFTATNSCGSTTGQVVVNVDTIIQGFLAAAAGGDTLCAGYQLALSGTGTDVNNWLWTGPNGFLSASQDTTVTNATTLNNGQYVLTASNACQTLRDTLNIHVESGNTINLVASSSATHDSACFGDTVRLFATDSFDSYNWHGPAGFVSFVQNPVIINAGTAQSGNYVVTGVNRCGRKTDSVHVYIDTIPQGLQLSSTGVNNTSCQGQSITVTASSPGINNWRWTGPAGFTSNNALFTIPNIQPNQQGNYIVTATNACGSSVDTIDVTVNALPDSLFVNTSSDSICPNVALVLTARSGLTNVVWSGGQTGNSINATQPGTYSYTGNDGNGCAVSSDTIHLYNANAPVLNLFANNPKAVCVGQPAVVLHASSDASVSFVWTPGGATTDSLVVTQPGLYSVVGSKGGCYVKDSINVASGTIPTVTFGADSVLFTCCTNPEVTPVVSGNVTSYQWSDASTGNTDLLTQSGLYTLTITTNQGCTATASVNFNKQCIGAQALAIPDSVQAGDATSLHVTTSIATALTYQWTPADSISNSTIANPMADPQQTTTYQVIVRDTLSGCVDTGSVTVYVLYQANFAIPNVFAPNNGGPNSTWYVINQGGLVTVEDMKVFDRWGEEVFESQRDGTLNWNGRYEGKLQPMGNYVYMVKVKIIATGKEQVVRGNLSLIW